MPQLYAVERIMKWALIFISLIFISCGGKGSMPITDCLEKDCRISRQRQQTAGPNRTPVLFSTIQNKIFTPKCTMCHGKDFGAANLKLDKDNAYNMLVNVASVEDSGRMRVLPLRPGPTSSYIIAKIIEDKSTRFAARMPQGGPYLSDSEIQMIKDWIDQGAQNN